MILIIIFCITAPFFSYAQQKEEIIYNPLTITQQCATYIVSDDGQCSGTLVGHKSDIWSVCWNPDGKRLVSGSADKTIKVWNIELLNRVEREEIALAPLLAAHTLLKNSRDVTTVANKIQKLLTQ